jgi:hypothetical protein
MEHRPERTNIEQRLFVHSMFMSEQVLPCLSICDTYELSLFLSGIAKVIHNKWISKKEWQTQWKRSNRTRIHRMTAIELRLNKFPFRVTRLWTISVNGDHSIRERFSQPYQQQEFSNVKRVQSPMSIRGRQFNRGTRCQRRQEGL